MLDRLVAIAVAERNLVAPHARHQDDAVRGRRPVGDEVRAVGAKHARRVVFRFSDGARVVEQGADLAHRDRNVGAKQFLAEELHEGAARRVLHEGRSAGVSGRVPRVLVLVSKIGKRLEHRWQQGGAIAVDRGHDTAADEVGRILEEPDVVVHLGQHLGRHVSNRAAGGQQENRQPRGVRSYFSNDVPRSLVVFRAGQVPVEQNRLQQ